ncbi:MAG: DNA-3-methyladenine glycosylase [Firmicutes bacterium]|nr:DNA-3-methyladenine glycosylase [Bacillota bacterium]
MTILDKALIPLDVGFYLRDTEAVAIDLLGRLLVRKTPDATMIGRIVEVEAYFGEDDPASHASRGMTPRNSVMFGRAGIAYVYLNYGVHHLLNVVTGPEGTAGAVLIRAVEPVSGIDEMMKNRPVKNKVNLTNGPGKLTKALKVDINDNGTDLTSDTSDLYIAAGLMSSFKVVNSPRIGISSGTDLLLRFAIKGNPYVSR